MTREEVAIKSCEDRIKHLKSAPPHHYGKRQRERAIELEKVKIKALRPVRQEQVEKVWHGRWIKHEGYDECSECHAKSIFGYNYCHNCGASMTGEAVQKVMERLEALYEST